jgi:GNAT superfamily N-acetyltransferase
MIKRSEETKYQMERICIHMDLRIKIAKREDLQAILELQYLAFQKEAIEYSDFTIEPLKQTVAGIEDEFQSFTFLKALDESGVIIGSARGCVKLGTSHINKILVHPDFQGKGIGSKLIAELESINPAPRYEISASTRCPRNIRLYEHLGYVKFKETKTVNNGFVYLEKLSANANKSR